MFRIPCPLVPMAPTLARPPFHRDGWIYEEKVDGWRIVAYKDGSRVPLLSRIAVDHRPPLARSAQFVDMLGDHAV